MTRARWILGTLGALAAVAFVPAAQAAPTPIEADFSTEITNTADGSHWAVFGDPVIKSVPFGAYGAADKWMVSHQYDGSVTLRDQRWNRCAEAAPQPGSAVLAMPCQPGNPAQNWVLEQRENGYVFTPQAAPDLAVSVHNLNAPTGSWLTLEPRGYDDDFGAVDGGSIFRLGSSWS